MILKGLLYIILSLGFSYSSIIASCQNLSYKDFMCNINELESKEQFELASEYLKEHKAGFPNEYFELSKEEIYINEKLQKFAENLAIFKEGHERGYFYLIDERLPKYEPYIKLPEFNSISEYDLKLRDKAIKDARIIYEVELPKGFSNTHEWPLCLIFHGGGSNLEEVKKHWHSRKLDSGFIKIYFQSYRCYDSKTYGWTSGDERADKELKQLWETITNKYPIDYNNIIAAGISAGGTFAIDVSVRKTIPATSFLTICPGIPRILLDEKIQDVTSLHLNGIIIGGENDYYLAQQRQLVEIFHKKNNPIKYIIISNMGHEYPPDEAQLIDEAIMCLSKRLYEVSNNFYFNSVYNEKGFSNLYCNFTC